ncbi:hypothetical protein ACR8AL_00940 [Clavibacter sepedonicus]|uniref:Exported protein n=1 Tax=Clavibacter sepedonicus TaxID=31964 RepID=B0RF19_CLASE|nr:MULTISPECIES: hypothetical protein [Clavibacter]MBD5383357.1 hypothetical protein [Clavibacter sp.]OQJ49310.1 hypothetical protein B5P19_14495 [Clavibacter sepedonicus]OQJ54925.1 hypothetical protein B5P20_13075 [Clavibacter sepedonicus]UUK64843.1 hypothetical protein LRE50_11155 [Clavibacter sepedonicus]CAQ00952.1 putative exported protein [Clavibacter sepedonicus]
MHVRTTASRPRRTRVALAALAIAGSALAGVGTAPAAQASAAPVAAPAGAATTATVAPAGDPVAASDRYVRRQTVHFSAHMQRYGDVVVSILIQGPNPGNGVPGWSRCVDLPQSGLPIWTDIGVDLLANSRYTVSSYSDFACSRGANYRWTTGTVDTRWTHWIVYPIRSPHVTLR